MRRFATRIRTALVRLLRPALDSHAAQRDTVRDLTPRGWIPERGIDVSQPAAAFWRASDARQPDPARARFAVTSELEVLPLSASMAGRRVVAVVLFGRDEFSAAERIVRARIAPNRADPALRDCLRDAVRKCRDSRLSPGEQP